MHIKNIYIKKFNAYLLILLAFLSIIGIVNAQSPITYYCASDSTFTTDLDTKNQVSCDNAKKTDGTSAGFRWTGTKCCSEDDDPSEYYNDANGIGGCWNKTAVLTGSTVAGRKDVANLNGVFYGCNINDNSVLAIKDIHTNQPLIQDKQNCFQDSSKFYFCSSKNEWEISSGKDKSHLSAVPDNFENVQQVSECCASDQCWNGQTCVENQRNKPNAQPVNGARCVDGNWVNASLKLSPDKTKQGFCPEQAQCFVDPFGKIEDNNKPDKKPVCITNEQFIRDDYCENGEWSSRTKFTALQMIELAKNSNYVLFCDTPKNALNNLNYLIQGQLASALISEENANNFCVLLFDNKVIAATSLNKPITEVDPFLKSIGVDNCNSALINDGQYHPCDTNKAWYNQKTNSLIYSQQSFTLGTTNFLDIFTNFIKNPFTSIKNSIKGNIEEPFDTSYLESISKFDKLYLSKQEGKEIKGSIEGAQFKNLVIEYKNFDTDICKLISEYNEKNKDPVSGIECSKQGTTYYVLAQGTEFTKVNPDSIWPDITSKLRVK